MQEGTPIIIKKVKKHAHGHHGGAWKVAYADFVTAMMAFFMVMWILGMSDEQKLSISLYFQDPIGFSKLNKYNPPNIIPTSTPASMQEGKSVGDKAHQQEAAELDSIQRSIEKEIQMDPALKGLADKGDIDTQVTDEGLQIELVENEANGEVFFQIGSAVVRPKAKAIFTKIAPIIAGTKRPIYVDGHTDNRPLTTPGYDNFNLSGDRANAVRGLLMQNGILDKQVLEVRAKADKEPRDPAHPDHFSNRRVTILMPWKYVPAPAMKLPKDDLKQSVEGMFRVPKNTAPAPVDITRK